MGVWDPPCPRHNGSHLAPTSTTPSPTLPSRPVSGRLSGLSVPGVAADRVHKAGDNTTSPRLVRRPPGPTGDERRRVLASCLTVPARGATEGHGRHVPRSVAVTGPDRGLPLSSGLRDTGGASRSAPGEHRLWSSFLLSQSSAGISDKRSSVKGKDLVVWVGRRVDSGISPFA